MKKLKFSDLKVGDWLEQSNDGNNGRANYWAGPYEVAKVGKNHFCYWAEVKGEKKKIHVTDMTDYNFVSDEDRKFFKL